MLQNKEGFWNSSDMWNFTPKQGWICIENIDKTKVWGIANDTKVILENFEEDNDGQLWKKGEPNDEGYFTLENFQVSKFVTAASSTSHRDQEPSLELKGNITLRWILPATRCLNSLCMKKMLIRPSKMHF
jgi:hypothetical protein